MDGGTVAPSAYAGAVVIRRWLVIGSGGCPDGRLGAYVMSTERVGATMPVPAGPCGAAAGLWADATRLTSQTFNTSNINDLRAFLETMDDFERSAASIVDAEAWHAIKTAAARRLTRLESEQAVSG